MTRYNRDEKEPLACRYCGQRAPCQCGALAPADDRGDPIVEMLIASMRHTRRTFEEARRIALGR